MVSGRLKADYNYGNTIVYNNFVKPTVNEKQKVEIERLAQAVLDACAQYPGSTIQITRSCTQNLRQPTRLLTARLRGCMAWT